MAEPKQISFTHKEIAELLVKGQGLHEGIWGIFIKFGLRGMNVGTADSDLLPAAIVPVAEIGLQRFDSENNLSVDAAKVNPAPGSKPRGRKR